MTFTGASTARHAVYNTGVKRHLGHNPRDVDNGKNGQWVVLALLGLYNVAMVMAAMALLPILVPLSISRKRRLLTVKQRLWWPFDCHNHGRGGKDRPLWVHALSVGEVMAAQPLVDHLRAHHPERPVVFSASTLTGFETARRIFKDSPIGVAFFPYDLILSVRSAVARIDPLGVILVETDIWPNFIAEMNRCNIPVYLVNMRLSDTAWRRYRKCKWMAAKLFGAFTRICVQTRRDARRMVSLGIRPQCVCVAGNMKFDGLAGLQVDDAALRWRNQLKIGGGEAVLVAGSTHDGEETIVLEAFTALKKELPATRLVIAPRDPERSAHVLSLCRKHGVSCRSLSSVSMEQSESVSEVVVVDFLGALQGLYALADVAFVGGSLSRDGGHNPIEPAACGKPVLFGPDMRDFRQITDWLIAAGGASQVMDAEQLAAQWQRLLGDGDLSEKMGRKAYETFDMHQGAVSRIMAALELDENMVE
jgi:3-deoxy-D-manno-octulosonic-acid transferase